jgi:hypothetical protein
MSNQQEFKILFLSDYGHHIFNGIMMYSFRKNSIGLSTVHQATEVDRLLSKKLHYNLTLIDTGYQGEPISVEEINRLEILAQTNAHVATIGKLTPKKLLQEHPYQDISVLQYFQDQSLFNLVYEWSPKKVEGPHVELWPEIYRALGITNPK